MNTVEQSSRAGLTRRNLLTGAAALAAASAATGCGDITALPLPTPSLGLTDNDILNFALNLEYLEAEFYLRAATGSGLSAVDAGGSSAGAVNGPTGSGPLVTSTNAVFVEFLNEFAQSELSHVRYLRQQLGSSAVVRPVIDLQTSFQTLAAAAGLPNASTFNPFLNFNTFLIGVSLFEDIGVTAYTGAAPYITSATILSAAAGIQAKEAYTGALARTLIASYAVADAANFSAANKLMAQVGVLATADGSTSAGVTPISTGLNSTSTAVAATSGSTLTPGDTNSKAFGRTPNQILHIVYGKTGAGVNSGGFFPNGLNGTVKTTSS